MDQCGHVTEVVVHIAAEGFDGNDQFRDYRADQFSHNEEEQEIDAQNGEHPGAGTDFLFRESGFLQKRGIEPVADQLIGTVEHKGDDQCDGKGHDHRSDPADLTEDTVQMGHS